jgi:DNA-binding transcriptional ArsR family regulator
MSKKTELILHPIRMRIFLTLAKQNLTPLQLYEELVNVPQATLYRHLNKLVQAEILRVVGERPVRGTVEKVYGINTETMNLENKDVLQASREELLELFTNFVMGKVRDFATYLQRDEINLIEDKISFRQAPLYLNEDEFNDLAFAVGQAFNKHLANKPAPGRKSINWTNIIIPGPEEDSSRPDTDDTKPETD